MQVVERFPWSELVPGHYVYDATGTPWMVGKRLRGRLWLIAADGRVAVVDDPGKPVRAAVPTEVEATERLHNILGARPVAG